MKAEIFNKIAWILLLCILMFVLVFPILWILFLSARPEWKMFEPIWSLPFDFTLENYSKVLNLDFLSSMKNSLIIALITAGVSSAIAAPAAFSLSQWKFKANGFVMWFVLVLRMASPIGFAIPLFLAYVKIGLVDTYLGMVLAYLTFSLPLAIWLMWLFFNELPKDIFEAGIVDGASVYKTLLKIGLPLAAPGILSSIVLIFGSCWNEFFYALVLARSNVSTGTVAIMNFITYSSYDWGGVTSACVILILPTIPISYFMKKYLVKGFMSGSVKG